MKKKLMFFAVFSLIVGLATITGCKKNEGVYILEGTINDNTLGQPIANQTLVVSTQNAGSSTFLTHSSITTDANGKYHVEIERGQLDKIKITGDKANYFQIEFVVSVAILTIDETYVINQATSAKSWARLIFNHQSGDPAAILEYTKNEGKQDCNECCPKVTQTISGFVTDTIYCINDGNTNYSYTYNVLGTGNVGTKTCYTPAFDTGQVVLNY